MPNTTPRYRLYRFDSFGHIVSFVELNCRTDFEAIEEASKLAGQKPQELWSGTKLLVTIQAQTTAAES